MLIAKKAPRMNAPIRTCPRRFMLEGLNTDVIDARGESLIAHLWTLVIFGDYMCYYLAMAYGVDPL